MAYIGRYGWNTLRVGGGIPDDEVLDAVPRFVRRRGRPPAEVPAPLTAAHPG
jgi:hypothetical protein